MTSENKSAPTLRKYRKNEYCKSIGCPALINGNTCLLDDLDCLRSAAQFHHWLQENGFKIEKVK